MLDIEKMLVKKKCEGQYCQQPEKTIKQKCRSNRTVSLTSGPLNVTDIQSCLYVSLRHLQTRQTVSPTLLSINQG